MALSTAGMRVYDLGHRILQSVEGSALELGVILPDKRIVTGGEAVHDCELVSVTALRVSTGIPDAGGAGGFPGAQSAHCYPVWSLNAEVSIVRCVSDLAPDGHSGVVPGPLINNAFIAVSKDAEVLMNSVALIAASPENFGNVTCTVSVPPPSGGMQSVKAIVTAVLA